jgi:hypothetical protein
MGIIKYTNHLFYDQGQKRDGEDMSNHRVKNVQIQSRGHFHVNACGRRSEKILRIRTPGRSKVNRSRCYRPRTFRELISDVVAAIIEDFLVSFLLLQK